MATYTLSKKDLAAMLLFASKQDIRYYLNGVMLAVSEKGAHLVATNGHILGTLKLGFNGAGPVRDFIIPRDVIAGFKPKPSEQDAVVLTIPDGDNPLCVLRDPESGWVREFRMIEGKYPDYTRVFSFDKPSNIPAQFNPEYLGYFHKAAALLSPYRKGMWDKYVYLTHNTNSILVTLADARFAGVMMAMHDDGESLKKTTPTWVNELRKETP